MQNLDTIVVRLPLWTRSPSTRRPRPRAGLPACCATSSASGSSTPPRSDAGYRLYGAAELQRLRTLRELLQDFDLGLGEMGFAQRLRTDSELRASVDAWFETQPQRPDDVPASDWLRFEQDKHERLLAAAAALT